jgi:hypothetical protein
MSPRKRGRPEGRTFEEISRQMERAIRIELLARETSTKAAAEKFGLTDRQVRNIRRFYREEIEPQARWWKEVANSPEVQARGKLFAAARATLSPGEWDALQGVRGLVGLQILQRLINGAAAEKENEQLRAEIEKLKKQAMVRADFRATLRK